jgi:hypothetical protein
MKAPFTVTPQAPAVASHTSGIGVVSPGASQVMVAGFSPLTNACRSTCPHCPGARLWTR